jgi:hypothetical protein
MIIAFCSGRSEEQFHKYKESILASGAKALLVAEVLSRG